LEKYRLLIFDFDLTLADSSDAIVECMNYAFGKMNLPPIEPGRIKKTIGMSLPKAFTLLTSIADETLVQLFRGCFREKSNKIMVDWTVVFEQVPEILERLKSDGHKLAIVSNKYHSRIEGVLQRENLLNYFDMIIGGDDVVNHKPDPEGVFKCLEKLSETGPKAAYIGDSLIDAFTTENAGIDFIAVLSGNTSEAEFNGYKPTKIIQSLQELPQIL